MPLRQAIVQFVIMAILLTLFNYYFYTDRPLSSIVQQAVAVSFVSIVIISILQRYLFR